MRISGPFCRSIGRPISSRDPPPQFAFTLGLRQTGSDRRPAATAARAARSPAIGLPLTSGNVVRKTSCRRAISFERRSSAGMSSGPRTFNARYSMYVGRSGSRRSRNQSASWFSDKGNAPGSGEDGRGTGTMRPLPADGLALQGRFDAAGQFRDRSAFEHVAKRQRDRLPQAGRDLVEQDRGLQRISAQLEEVVVDADAFDPQHGRPGLRQRLLQSRLRSDVGRGQVGPPSRTSCPACDGAWTRPAAAGAGAVHWFCGAQRRCFCQG